MTGQEMWDLFCQENPQVTQDLDAWQFGAEADLLARLVLEGKKTATSSAYDLYQVENEELPKVRQYSVVLDSKDKAVCVIETVKVTVLAFKDVSADFARKEGEGDLSLAYWRQVHEEFFSPSLAECGLEFSEESLVVCEEFQVVFKR